MNLDFADGVVHNGSVTLYRVAELEGDAYMLRPSFGGGLVRKRDAGSAALAQWLCESAQEAGDTRILDADGSAWFGSLDEGLYLLVQAEPMEGMENFAPMLIQMPSMDQWELVALPQYSAVLTQLPQTGQHFSPVLAAMVMVISGLSLYFLLDRRKRK
ncbi:MAG: LPXTG cell wall anchor domain-containing protein [Oscillospiraceae bacterium]|nr:LPXTG cell wall anchor domain-containing protein [Oscillospiraceae bacterium]